MEDWYQMVIGWKADFRMIANFQALKNADEEIDFQTDFVTEIARFGSKISVWSKISV